MIDKFALLSENRKFMDNIDIVHDIYIYINKYIHMAVSIDAAIDTAMEVSIAVLIDSHFSVMDGDE